MDEALPTGEFAVARQCAACGRSSAQHRCTKCHVVAYCSKECQQLHWPVHQAICGQVSAPAGGADAGAGGQPREATSKAVPAGLQPVANASTGGLSALAAASRQLDDPASTSRMMAAGYGGLRALAMASKDYAQKEAESTAALQGMHALIAAEIECEKQLEQLVMCLQSIVEQWRAPPDQIFISWHSGPDLYPHVAAALEDFKAAIDALGERVTYNASQERVVRSHVHLCEQSARFSQFQHFSALLPLIPEGDDNWVMFSGDNALWHPGRTAFLRNFTRQVPGPEECLVCAVPLHLRPVRSHAIKTPCDAGSFQECMRFLKQNQMVYGSNTLEPFQFCVRRSLFAKFFDKCNGAVLEHKLCYGRFAMFLMAEHKHVCRWIVADSPAHEQLKNAHMWLMFDRRVQQVMPKDAPMHPARGFGHADVCESDLQRARESLDVVNEVHVPGLDAESLAEDIAELRKLVDWCTLLQWEVVSRQERIVAVKRFVESEYMNDTDLMDSWTTPLLEQLLDDCLKAFDLEAFAEIAVNDEGDSCPTRDAAIAVA